MNTLKDYRIIGLCPCQAIMIDLHLGHQHDDGQRSCSRINILLLNGPNVNFFFSRWVSAARRMHAATAAARS